MCRSAHIIVHVLCVCLMPTEARRSYHVLATLLYRWLQATLWVLETEPRSSVWVTVMPNHWTISPSLKILILKYKHLVIIIIIQMIGTVLLKSEIWLLLYYIWKSGCKINGVQIHSNLFYFILQEREGRRGGERLRRRERGEGGGGRQRCDLIGGFVVSDLWTIGRFRVYLQPVSQHFPLPK